jgi:FkbM family methyltransferase
MKIPKNCNKLYIDIGLSSEAIQTQSWLEKVPNAFSIGFEPSPEARRKIYSEGRSDTRWLKRENFDRLHIEDCALSNFVGTATFYRPNIDVGCSSLYKPAEEKFNGIREEYEVEVNTLQNYFSNNPSLLKRFSRIEYMKIDAQGSDLKILKGAEDILEEVVWITAEGDGGYYIEDCGETDKCKTENITRFLTNKGFVKYNHPNTTDPTFYNPKFADYMSVFINQY